MAFSQKKGSVWLEGYTPFSNPLSEDIECDVAVVGAGIIGAAATYRLACEGVFAVVLEKDFPGAGSTGFSGGFLTPATSFDLRELMELGGERKGVRMYESIKGAIGAMEETVRKESIGCGFVQTGAWYIAAERSHIKKIRSEYETLKKFGIQADFFPAGDTRPPMTNRFGAVKTYGDYVIHPVKFIEGLLRAAMQQGIKVFINALVTSLVEDDNRVVLTTSDGRRITARHAIVAGSGWEEAQRLAPRKFRESVIQFVSHILLTKPIREIHARWKGELVWDTYMMYHYLRLLDDGRVMIGGEDRIFAETRHGTVTKNTKENRHLRRVLHTLFPDYSIEIDYGWSGGISHPLDGLPIVCTRGAITWIVAEGLPPGWISANMAVDRILKGRSEYDDLYDMNRSFGGLNNIFLALHLPFTLKRKILKNGLIFEKLKDLLDEKIRY